MIILVSLSKRPIFILSFLLLTLICFLPTLARSQSNVFVSTTGSEETGDGSQANPFASIQQAIDQSSDGDVINVAAGTYIENINFNGKNIWLLGEDRETTIIDGNQNGSVVVFESGETDATLLSHFTITNGDAEKNDSATIYDKGGGIHCFESNPAIRNVIIRDNDGNEDGGGIYIRGSNPLIENAIIAVNFATHGGGISCVVNSSPIFTNVVIAENSASGYGGGIFTAFSGNPILTNVTITSNKGGGGLHTSDSPVLKNVTISNNAGSGIQSRNGADLIIVNTILWNNSPQEFSFFSGDSAITISYSEAGDRGIKAKDRLCG